MAGKEERWRGEQRPLKSLLDKGGRVAIAQQ